MPANGRRDLINRLKFKTHIFCSLTFLEIRAVYEIRSKNIAEPGRPQMTMWLMRIAS